jgi:hypothetical protein
MNRQLTFLFIIPLFTLGQTAKFPTTSDLTKTYTHAISDFIKAANKKNKSNFDTLFFGKHVNGQPDDFPNIKLPKTIENIQIRVITPEVGAEKQKERKSRVYINLMGWVDKENADFIFVVFSNGFVHQYDYSINYEYDVKRKEFELKKLEFKGPPFVK